MGAVLSASFRADPVRASLNLVLMVSAQLSQVFVALALKAITNAIIQRDLHGVLIGAIAMGAIGAVGVMSGISQFNLGIALRENVMAYLDRRLIQLVTAVPGLEHH